MNLTTFEELLQDYIEDQLDTDTRAKMDLCLRESAECRSLLEAWRTVDSEMEKTFSAATLQQSFSNDVLKLIGDQTVPESKEALKSALAREFQREIRRLRRSVAIPRLRDIIDFVGVVAVGSIVIWGIGPSLTRLLEPFLGPRFEPLFGATGASLALAVASLAVFGALAVKRAAAIPRW